MKFSEGYKIYGFNIRGKEITFKEWAPGAKEVFLVGDFND